MLKYHFGLMLSFLLLGTASSLLAEDVPSSSLTFSDCINETKNNNPELSSLYYSKEATEYQREAAKSEYYPTINAGIGGEHGESDHLWSHSSSRITQPDGSVVNMRSRSTETTSINGSVTVRQNVFSGFARDAAVEQANAANAQSRANISITKARLSADLKIAYSTLVYWQRYVTLATKIAQRRQENLGVVKLRYEGGSENKGSYLQAQALYNQAVYEKTQAVREVEAAKNTLAKILGRNTSFGLTVVDNIPTTLITKYDIESELEYHPEVLLAKAQRENAEAALKSARSGYYPSVDLSAKADTMEGRSMHDNESYAVGFDVSIPIFTFGRTKNRVSQAQAELEAARAQEKATIQTVRDSIINARTELASATDKVAIQTSLREASSVRAEIGRHKYNIGMLDFENWDIIETELINYQKAELLSERDKAAAEANWERAIGVGVL